MPYPLPRIGLAGASSQCSRSKQSRPILFPANVALAPRNLFQNVVAVVARNRQERLRQAQHLAFLSSLLHEPEWQVQQWLVKNRRYLAIVERFRNARQCSARLLAHRASFKLERQREFRELLRSDRRSRLLMSFHAGDFIYGNNVLADCEQGTRQQYFLTQLPPTDAFLDNMRGCFGEQKFNKRQQLLVEKTSPAALAALLRRPHHTLLSFADLPAGFGERIEVRFLGRRAWFPRGPATLAMLCKVPVLPVAHYWDGKFNRIQLFEQLEPRIAEGETLQQATGRMTQSLAGILEQVIAMNPWQWRFLSALPGFFVEPLPNPQHEGLIKTQQTHSEQHDSTHSDKERIHDNGRQKHRTESTQSIQRSAVHQ